tara:strand:+ start:1325 stop:3196 length:1872 start_codon:yes stop_codon:yes gene_type:complete
MALQKLQFKPGINQDVTNYSNEGGWYECDKVRFLKGYPEKIKGWQTNTSRIAGTCRALFGWITSFSDNFLAIGTNNKVYIEVASNLNDITPIRSTTSAGDVTFAASNGSSTITVTDASHGAATGDFVTFSDAATLGGNITASVLNQNYQVTKINDNTFSFTAKNTSGEEVLANSSDSGNGGGATVGTYEITAGSGFISFGYGWNTSTWGRSTWGSGSLQPVINPLTVWFFDNFDNDLIMNVNTDGKGAIYYWERGSNADPESVLGTRAVLLSSRSNASDVPDEVGQIMVSQVDRHLIAFGATPFGGDTFDPLLIRFANQDEPENFTPSTLNSAGFIRVSSGSQIITAFRTRQEILIFTDMSLHSMQFLGTTDVFGLQELETNISVASPRCVAGASNVVYWMGADKFYLYNGKVATLPCTLRDFVFNNINFDALAYVYAGTIESQSEVWWFYPSANSTKNDSYVVYNYQDNLWFYGSLDRSAWLDANLRNNPQAVGEDTLFNHEIGNDADGSAMTSFITSSDFDIGDGDKFTLVNRIIPDVSFTGSNANEPKVKMTVKPRNFPGSTYSVENDKNVIETDVNVYTEQVFLRARARQMGFKITSDTLGTTWKLGSPRLDGRPDGRR